MPRVENMGSSLNEKEETQGAALEPVFRINEIILSGQGEKFGRHKIIYGKDSALIPWKKRISHQRRRHPEHPPPGAGVEQMKRVSSLDVSMKLLPADNI